MDPNRTARRADGVSASRRTDGLTATVADVSRHLDLSGCSGDPDAWCAGRPGTGRPADADGRVATAVDALMAQLL